MPSAAQKPLRDQLVEAPGAHAHGTLAWTALLSLVVALSSIASAFRATAHALNVISEVPERRSQPRLFAVSLVAAVAVGLLVLGAIICAVAGRQLAADVGNGGVAISGAWTVIAWSVLAVVFWATIALSYAFGPSVHRGFRWASAGSVLATVLWVTYTAIFAVYVNLLSQPAETYGALAGIAITMLYVYATAFIVLLGYQVDCLIELRSQQ